MPHRTRADLFADEIKRIEAAVEEMRRERAAVREARRLKEQFNDHRPPWTPPPLLDD
jgi:hypothetical protein